MRLQLARCLPHPCTLALFYPLIPPPHLPLPHAPHWHPLFLSLSFPFFLTWQSVLEPRGYRETITATFSSPTGADLLRSTKKTPSPTPPGWPASDRAWTPQEFTLVACCIKFPSLYPVPSGKGANVALLRESVSTTLSFMLMNVAQMSPLPRTSLNAQSVVATDPLLNSLYRGLTFALEIMHPKMPAAAIFARLRHFGPQCPDSDTLSGVKCSYCASENEA